MRNETLEFKPKISEKRWNPIREAEIFQDWENAQTNIFIQDSRKPIYSIDTPPPYASGRWHIGGATHYAQIDMVARYFRMRGYEVNFPFGIDRNGLPVEVAVEKKNNISAHEQPRERFIQLCKEFLDKVEIEIIATAKKLGISANFDAIYRTDSPEYRSLTQKTFIELWLRGLIYFDDRPTNWCPVCQTTIADAELEYINGKTELCYIKFGIQGGGEITIATTRPELICSCGMVICHPQDERFHHLQNKQAITPIYNQKIPIKSSNYAKPEFGTGLAMICSFGDYTDIRLYREFNLRPVIAITKNGRMNNIAGPYEGLRVKDARKKIIEDLQQQSLLIKKEEIMHSTPSCWRTKNPVEFINMEEYYLKQVPFLEDLRKITEQITFHPPESKQILLNWINSITVDWPISRRRYYGTEIPLWYCKTCRKVHVPTPDKYYQPWKDKAPFQSCDCGSTEFTGETKTFDTWMDSSISQLFITGYRNNEKLFQASFPCTLRPQGTDIVRTWLYYSILRTYQLFSSCAFENVRISGMGLNEQGEAMHKSKQNIIWSEPFLEKHGADAFRLWGAAESKLGSNYRFSRERLEGSWRFLTKLWNIARFTSCFPIEKSYLLTPLDRMFLNELNDLIRECSEGYEQMDFFIPAQAIRRFVWNSLADHYIEAVKTRAYNFDNAFKKDEQAAAWFTLHTCLRTALRLLAPVCPFITEAIWQEIYSKNSIHRECFPEQKEEWKSAHGKLLIPFTEFNSAVWKFKKSRNIALREGIKRVYASKTLDPLKADLKAMHKIEALFFGVPSETEAFEVIGEVYLAT